MWNYSLEQWLITSANKGLERKPNSNYLHKNSNNSGAFIMGECNPEICTVISTKLWEYLEYYKADFKIFPVHKLSYNEEF